MSHPIGLISPIIRYNLADGAHVMWMGDLETDFMEKIKDAITPEASHVLFAPHHGRKSGRVSNSPRPRGGRETLPCAPARRAATAAT